MSNTIQPTVAVIGAGPAGLAAAERLALHGFSVTVYDQKLSPARKFLMAGRGGLNITHSEPFESFLARYGDAAEFLRPALTAFPPEAVRAWCAGLGEETFVGTSGRVFPKSFKATPLLRAWLDRLTKLGVTFRYNFVWTGQTMDADKTILALGGASWPRLGSDGHWTDILKAKGVGVTPLRPANCGFLCDWSPHFREKFAGTPLKSVILTCGDRELPGELMITKHGIEGGAVYALSRDIRTRLEQDGESTLFLDFKPALTLEQVESALSKPRGRDSFSNFLRKTLALPPVAVGLLQEDRSVSSLSVADLARRIKSFPLSLNGTAPIDRAISTAGGIALSELNPDFSLKKIPDTYAVGEMLDWEAPTGGYLLTACLATGFWAGEKLRTNR